MRLLHASDDPSVSQLLLKRHRKALLDVAATADPARTPEMPLGPELFALRSRVDCSAREEAGTPSDVENLVESAVRLWPHLASIPMTEDEYRLYALLYLRMCATGGRSARYTEARAVAWKPAATRGQRRRDSIPHRAVDRLCLCRNDSSQILFRRSPR